MRRLLELEFWMKWWSVLLSHTLWGLIATAFTVGAAQVHMHASVMTGIFFMLGYGELKERMRAIKFQNAAIEAGEAEGVIRDVNSVSVIVEETTKLIKRPQDLVQFAFPAMLGTLMVWSGDLIFR